MRPQSVKRTAEQLEPVKKYIEACWNSPKRYHVFCLVEGEFDKHIYEARLNAQEIEVKIAADDKLNHNRSSVRYLVEDLRAMHPNGRFIGIRDKDYMTMLGQTCPVGIYVTDNRDLEMTVLASPSFQASETTLVSYLPIVFHYCQLFAHIRVFAESRNLRNKVNDNMSIDAVYNQQTKQFAQNPLRMLRDLYYNKVDAAACDKDIDDYINCNNLLQYAPYDICRGHDVIGLLEFVHGNTYSRNAMEKRMEINYDKADFYSTSLFADIQQYCQVFGINAKI